MDKALHFYEAVKWAEKNGITGGIGSGLFGPNNDCTCTQIVTLIPPGEGAYRIGTRPLRFIVCICPTRTAYPIEAPCLFVPWSPSFQRTKIGYPQPISAARA